MGRDVTLFAFDRLITQETNKSQVFAASISPEMSSDSETSILSDTSETSEEESRDSDDDWEGIASQYSPYQDEPLADDTDDETDYGGEEELDIDGLTPTVLAERYERTVTVDSWLVRSFVECL